jgi:hypothetical protein
MSIRGPTHHAHGTNANSRTGQTGKRFTRGAKTAGGATVQEMNYATRRLAELQTRLP